MRLRWNNGILNIGYLLYADAFGIELAWGRRDLMGEDVRDGEAIFADHKVLYIVSGASVAVYGGVWRAIAARVLGIGR